MKRIIFSIITAVLASITLVRPAMAESQNLFYGEYHSYSVNLKEDGEAVVFAKLVFTNTGEQDKKTYTFTAKDSKIKELTVLQVKLPQECADYTQIYDSVTGKYKCARYRDPDYNSYYYYYYGSTDEIKYQSAKVSNNGLEYSVDLPEPVKQDKTSALLLAYTSTDYTKNNIMAKSYDFPTLTIDNRITESKIGISVDDGLVLEGTTTPEYCTMGMCPVYSTDSAKVSSVASGSSSAPVTNRSLDNLYASIGSGQRTYQAKSIAPNKSYNAKGRYAKSEIQLNLIRILAAAVGAAIFIGIVLLASAKFTKKINNKTATSSKWSKSWILGDMVPVASLVPMACLVGGTWYISTANFSRNVWDVVGQTGRPLVVVLIIFIYFALVGITPLIYALKKGWKSTLAVIVMQIIWATLLLAIALPVIIFTN